MMIVTVGKTRRWQKQRGQRQKQRKGRGRGEVQGEGKSGVRAREVACAGRLKLRFNLCFYARVNSTCCTESSRRCRPFVSLVQQQRRRFPPPPSSQQKQISQICLVPPSCFPVCQPTPMSSVSVNQDLADAPPEPNPIVRAHR